MPAAQIARLDHALFPPLAQTSTATSTQTPSQTPSPSAYSPSAFNAGNVVVLRLGDPSYNARSAAIGYPLPVYLDELAVGTGALVRSVPLPMASCVLGTGGASTWFYDTDGFPQLSDNGQVRDWSATEGRAR